MKRGSTGHYAWARPCKPERTEKYSSWRAHWAGVREGGGRQAGWRERDREAPRHARKPRGCIEWGGRDAGKAERRWLSNVRSTRTVSSGSHFPGKLLRRARAAHIGFHQQLPARNPALCHQRPPRLTDLNYWNVCWQLIYKKFSGKYFELNLIFVFSKNLSECF